MLSWIKTLIAALIGAALGLAATWTAMERGHGFSAVSVGPWTAWPRSAYANADPYTRAIVARSGEIPLSLSEGIAFIARTDDAGAPLTPACDYVISSPIPSARFWSLTAMTPHGRLIQNPAGILGLTSAEIVRDSSGQFRILASTHARPGNWLPLAPGRPFQFVLRLYDTPTSSGVSSLRAQEMPGVRRGACE